MKHRMPSLVALFVGSTLLCLIGVAGCGSSSEERVPDSTAIAGTVIAQITGTAESVALPTSIAATVIARLTSDAPTAEPTSLPTYTQIPSPRPTASQTLTRGPTDTPEPTFTPRPTATPQYGTVGNPVPFGVTVEMDSHPRRSNKKVMSVRVLDVIRGRGAQQLARQQLGFTPEIVEGKRLQLSRSSLQS